MAKALRSHTPLWPCALRGESGDGGGGGGSRGKERWLRRRAAARALANDGRRRLPSDCASSAARTHVLPLSHKHVCVVGVAAPRSSGGCGGGAGRSAWLSDDGHEWWPGTPPEWRGPGTPAERAAAPRAVAPMRAPDASANKQAYWSMPAGDMAPAGMQESSREGASKMKSALASWGTRSNEIRRKNVAGKVRTPLASALSSRTHNSPSSRPRMRAFVAVAAAALVAAQVRLFRRRARRRYRARAGFRRAAPRQRKGAPSSSAAPPALARRARAPPLPVSRCHALPAELPGECAARARRCRALQRLRAAGRVSRSRARASAPARAAPPSPRPPAAPRSPPAATVQGTICEWRARAGARARGRARCPAAHFNTPLSTCPRPRRASPASPQPSSCAATPTCARSTLPSRRAA